MTRAMILCAGFGTRLRPLTDELPKPLAPIGDRSILSHTASHLAKLGVADAVINVHHLADRFSRIINDLPLKVQIVRELEIRGTAGGVAGARSHFTEAPVLVWNGDILVKPPVSEVLACAAEVGVCLCVAERVDGRGTVGLDARGSVVRLRGECFGEEVRSADYVGVLALSGEVLGALPERGCLIGDVTLPILRRGGRVAGVAVTGGFLDAGDPETLLRANLDWLEQRVLASYVAPGVEVDPGVSVERSVVSRGARVRGHGALRECLICEGAEVTAPLSRAIVTPSGRIIHARISSG
ncbi:MAG TPA: nucleotidyltransferase family protein [Polyangiaceae bacterium]|jgi:mannose-1-phosphate guanylyltransferase